MKIRGITGLAVVLSAAALLAPPASAEPDRSGAPVVVVAVPVAMTFGTNIVAPRWEVRLDTCANPPPCPVDVDFTVGEIGDEDDGTTLWGDARSPGFQALTTYLTDGVSNLLGWGVLTPISPSFAVGTETFSTEAQFLQTESDLHGWTLSRIGFHVDEAVIESPGQDLNRDGVWTDVHVRGAFLFEALLSSPSECMDGRWQELRRPDLSPFRSLGECVSYVVARPSE